MWKYILAATGGICAGILIDRAITYMIEKKKIKYEDILIKCFGEPMYMNVVSFNDLGDWANNRQDKMNETTKILVTKTTSQYFKDLQSQYNISGQADSFLLLALIDTSKQEDSVIESLLIKYNSIEESLNEKLSSSDGTLVIER